MAKTTLFGLHTVQAILTKQPHSVCEIWLQKDNPGKRLTELQALAHKQGIRVSHVASQVLNEKAQGNHQGIAASVNLPEAKREPYLFNFLDQLDEQKRSPFILILDGVTDPHNLGACLRCADAAGVDLVIVPKDKAVGLNATVAKVASGAAQWVPFVQVTNLVRTLTDLQARGIWLIGTSDKATNSLYQTDLKGGLGIVMGSEGKGLRRLTEERCDSLISIPMQGSVSSLNVSVAAGVCLFEALRQRQL